jgi:hypothetical protein
MRNRKSFFGVRIEAKNRRFSGDTCIVALTQATLTFHHTIDHRKIVERKKKAEPN